jgi:CPA1 family monovalent cation:H+ antiporter
MKKQFRSIALLSIGHVVFITLLVAIIMHFVFPDLGWPVTLLLGAIISPPDSVAITAIAEKVRMPERIFIILEGEGLFNDAAALTLFRFALAAAISHQISITYAIGAFSIIIISEIIYGFILGHILGKLRTKITNTALHVIASFITPFLAYVPSVKLGGSGIIATAIVGFIIGNQYSYRFSTGYRLAAFTLWPMFSFTIQSLIFLLVGLDLRSVFSSISSIPIETLMKSVMTVLSIVIIGRFAWVYGFVIFLPRFMFPSVRKNDPYPKWQYPFIIAWAGIRGGISLAAALAIPTLTLMKNNLDLRDFLVFLVLSVIFVTLILQGLSLPYILKKMGVDKVGCKEQYKEQLTELQTRIHMINAALRWLKIQKVLAKDNKELFSELSLHVSEYTLLKNQFKLRLSNHNNMKGPLGFDTQIESLENLSLLYQLVEIEKETLLKLWSEEKINLRTRNKLIASLDHQIARHKI